LFRIVQEALSNIRKHSGATKAEISLKFTSRKAYLNISDNGKGFVAGKVVHSAGKGSLGLVGMRERAHLIGAILKIKSWPQKGTVVSTEFKFKSLPKG
jgi:signal transduction histidine kinase